MKWTASVVGGGAGGKLSLSALHHSDYFDLKAVADLRPEVCRELEERYPGIKTYTSHEEMFADCATDVVCVSTFPPSHESVTMAALALPLKGILVEKPLGHTAKSGRSILEAIQAKRLPMAVPHNLLAKKTSLEIIERVRHGDIGELKLVEIQNTKWDIINAGIHWLNFFVTLTDNEPIDYVMGICEAGTRTYRDGMQVETTAVTYAQTRSGVRVVMNTGDDVFVNRDGRDTLFRIIGTGGQIEFWGWHNDYMIVNAQYPDGQWITPEELPVTGHRYHLENMVRLAESGEVDYRIAESSLTALEIVEAAYTSSAHRCKVVFPFEQFTIPERNDWQPGQPYAGSGGGRNGRNL